MSTAEDESMRDWVRRAITERGVEDVIRGITSPFCRACRETRLKRKIGAIIIPHGWENCDPDKLEEAVQCLVEELPTGEIRTNLEVDLAFWRENRKEIMDDHRMTPA